MSPPPLSTIIYHFSNYRYISLPLQYYLKCAGPVRKNNRYESKSLFLGLVFIRRDIEIWPCTSHDTSAIVQFVGQVTVCRPGIITPELQDMFSC
jgi:hypothetical protein